MSDGYFFLGFVGLAFAAIIWRLLNPPLSAEARIKEWADANRVSVLKSEKRHFLDRGPFSWQRGGRAVFHITVRKDDGQIRIGWLCLWGDFFSKRGGHEEIRWIESEDRKRG